MGRGRVAGVALALFVCSWLVYRAGHVAESYNITDPLLLVPTSMSMLHDGDLELSEFAPDFNPRFHGLLVMEGRPYNRYPIGASLVMLPLVWLGGAPPAGTTPMAHAMVLAASIAKVFAALSVALLFVLLAVMSGRIGAALGLALLFAFATPHYPIHGGAVWTHNIVLPLVLGTLLLLVVRDGRWTWSAAIPLALAFITRPTTASVVLIVSAYVAYERPRAAPAFALVGLAIAGVFCTWSHWMYGSVLPPYYLGYQTATSSGTKVNFWPTDALLGNLVSPQRGLFVFVPVFAFSLWGMVRAFRHGGRHATLLRALAILVVVHWVLISSAGWKWWAGWSYGPRNFMDVLPVFVVLLLPPSTASPRCPRAGARSCCRWPRSPSRGGVRRRVWCERVGPARLELDSPRRRSAPRTAVGLARHAGPARHRPPVADGRGDRARVADPEDIRMLGFTLSEEQDAFRLAVRDWASRALAPRVEALEATETFPVDLFKDLGRLGYLGVGIPEADGGSGGDMVMRCLLIEEIGRVNCGFAAALLGHVGLATIPLIKFGTTEQKERWLRPALRARSSAASACRSRTPAPTPRRSARAPCATATSTW